MGTDGSEIALTRGWLPQNLSELPLDTKYSISRLTPLSAIVPLRSQVETPTVVPNAPAESLVAPRKEGNSECPKAQEK